MKIESVERVVVVGEMVVGAIDSRRFLRKNVETETRFAA